VALLAAMGCLTAGCGGGGSGGGDADAAAMKDKGKKARKLALIDISVADYDGVALNEIIKIEFTERVNPDSVRPDTIQIREGPNYGKQVPGEFRIDGDVVWFYPTLPTKPTTAGSIGEVVYAGLKPGTTYQITMPGAPKVAVVRNFADGPLRKLYRERFRTAAAGTPLLYVDNFLDPLPAAVRFSNPPSGSVNVDSDTDILLTFNRRPLNPATVSRNTVRLTMLSRNDQSNLRSMPGEPVLDQSYDRVIIRFVPDFPLADNAVYRLTAERLEDLVGNDVEYFSATFTVRDEPTKYSQFVLTFDEYQKGAYMDDSQTTASWNVVRTDALAALFTAAGGTGKSGDLTPSGGVNIQLNAQTAPGVTTVDEDGMTYDVFNFRRITIPTNTTVSFVQRPGGPNRAIKVLSLFPIVINGTLSVRGGRGGDGESQYSTTTLPKNPGGLGGVGGGPGADAQDQAIGSVPGSASDRAARRKDAPDVPGGGYGGKGGDESGGTYYSWSGGGGGGGSRTDGQAGKPGTPTTYGGPGGAGGLGRTGGSSVLARQPNVGGAGGGAGGMGYYYYYPWRTGAGSGGGGGGAITLQSSADIRVTDTGRVSAAGGAGGNSIQPNYASGGGGGGGGGSIRIATTSNVYIDAKGTLDVAGGTGGLFSGGSGYYAGGAGGNGGEGFLCIAVPDRGNAVVSNTASLTYTPPYYDTTFAPAGGGAPSVGQTTWINLGVFDPDMLTFVPGSDMIAETYNDSLAIQVQMVLEDANNIGNPNLSAVDINDEDGDGQIDDTTNVDVMSDWVPIEQIDTLNGKHYQFIRVRATFQLDSTQTFNDQLPYVDEIALRFKY
jgi:hypothetical protein